MTRSESKTLVGSGFVTLGVLRSMLKDADAEAYGPSKVNPAISKFQAIEIFRRAIEVDRRADDTVMNGPRDGLTAGNILRTLGTVAYVKALRT